MSKLHELIAQYRQDKTKENFESIIRETQTCEMLWSAFSPTTKCHYIDYVDGAPTAFLFSEKSYCEAFCKKMKESGLTIGIAECGQKARLSMLADYHRCGVQSVILDNGFGYIVFDLLELVTPPDYSDRPEQDRPIFNPELMTAANRFFQCVENNSITPDKELQLLLHTYRGRYLVPVENEPVDQSVTIPQLMRGDGQKVIPFFTDRMEMKKLDEFQKYKAIVAGFDQIVELSKSGQIIVINPLGFNFTITPQVVEAVQNAVKAVPPEAWDNNGVVYTLDEEPAELIGSLNKLLDLEDKENVVKAAFLKGLRKQGTKGYLVVFDCGEADEETEKQLVDTLSEKAKALTGETPIMYVTAKSAPGKAGAQGVPFYRNITVDLSDPSDLPNW